MLVDRSNLRWWWCEDCGATRRDTRGRESFVDDMDDLMTPYQKGRWKSPRSLTE